MDNENGLFLDNENGQFILLLETLGSFYKPKGGVVCIFQQKII